MNFGIEIVMIGQAYMICCLKRDDLDQTFFWNMRQSPGATVISQCCDVRRATMNHKETLHNSWGVTIWMIRQYPSIHILLGTSEVTGCLSCCCEFLVITHGTAPQDDGVMFCHDLACCANSSALLRKCESLLN